MERQLRSGRVAITVGVAAAVLAALGLWALSATAVDYSITGLKLVVVDRVAAGRSKAVFVSRDPGINKGSGMDPTQIEAVVNIAYDGASGTFDMPAGNGWVANSASVAKYVNKEAPTGGAVKVGVIKPGLLLKMVGKSLGDMPLDISATPTGAIYVAYTVVNDGGTTRLCTQFSGCEHIANDAGYKLVCKGKGNSMGDPGCMAVPVATTTMTTQPSTSSITLTTSTTCSTVTTGTIACGGFGTPSCGFKQCPQNMVCTSVGGTCLCIGEAPPCGEIAPGIQANLCHWGACPEGQTCGPVYDTICPTTVVGCGCR